MIIRRRLLIEDLVRKTNKFHLINCLIIVLNLSRPISFSNECKLYNYLIFIMEVSFPYWICVIISTCSKSESWVGLGCSRALKWLSPEIFIKDHNRAKYVMRQKKKQGSVAQSPQSILKVEFFLMTQTIYNIWTWCFFVFWKS